MDELILVAVSDQIGHSTTGTMQVIMSDHLLYSFLFKPVHSRMKHTQP